MKTKLLIPAILFAGLCMAGCEEAQIEGSGHGSKVTPGGGGYDPDIEDPLPKLPELEEVEDVCTKMDDLQFMEYCYTNFDVNGDKKVSMSEANAVQEIECNTATSFTGIGYFSNLRGFRSASVKSVNLGYNKGLMSLDCSGSPVKVLDLRYNTQLSDIDVSQCTGLTKLLLAAEAPLTAFRLWQYRRLHIPGGSISAGCLYCDWGLYFQRLPLSLQDKISRKSYNDRPFCF